MISPQLTRRIEEEGKKKGFYIYSAGGGYDENDEFVFIIKLKSKGKPKDKKSKKRFWMRNARDSE